MRRRSVAGRRNLTRDQFTVLLGQRYAAVKIAGKPSVPGNRGSDVGHTRSDGYTRDIVADAVGMSGPTYQRSHQRALMHLVAERERRATASPYSIGA